MAYKLYDAHMHLNFMTNAREVAEEAASMGLRLFANSVVPAEFEHMSDVVADLANVDVGLGAHPWWVEQIDLNTFDCMLPKTKWVGEVGLDQSPRRSHHELQKQVFEHIARACADAGDKTLSIHSVRAAHDVLNTLERTGCSRSCRCIFHWFSGSTEDLWRAIDMGCWFSVNEMQASTRRAKEQLKLIPSDRLLFETDLPPREGEPFTAREIASSLDRVQTLVAEIRK